MNSTEDLTNQQVRKRVRATHRWVREAGKIRVEDGDFAADLESLDQTLSTNAIERLEELRAAEQES